MPELTSVARHGYNPTVTAAKVPRVTVLFWLVKIVTTAMGEAAADALAKVNIFLAAVIGIIGIAVALTLQLRRSRYVAGVYWFAVAMVAVFGTMVADGMHIELGIPYAVSTAACGIGLAIVFVAWRCSEPTLSIHSIVTRRREVFYWVTVVATFALGTAVGDFTAATLGLGFLASGLIFAIAMAGTAVAWRLGLNSVFAFWCAYVLTRPVGASFADWIGKPHSFGGGLGVGDSTVALVLAVLLVVLVGFLAARRNDIQPAAELAGP